MAPYVVFDHDGDTLQTVAENAGFAVVTTDMTGDAKDQDAASKLVKEYIWRIAFVHINQQPWEILANKAPESCVVLRFSTEGFPPTLPTRARALCLHCNRRIQDLEQNDVAVLSAVLNDESIRNGIRTGFIPSSIRHLIWFEEPHRLRSLHILMQGVLASLGADPGNQKSQQARECIGMSSIPVLPSQTVINKSTIRRALEIRVDDPSSAVRFSKGVACELGVRNLCEVKEINALVESIRLGAEAESLNPDLVIEGFEALDKVLSER